MPISKTTIRKEVVPVATGRKITNPLKQLQAEAGTRLGRGLLGLVVIAITTTILSIRGIVLINDVNTGATDQTAKLGFPILLFVVALVFYIVVMFRAIIAGFRNLKDSLKSTKARVRLIVIGGGLALIVLFLILSGAAAVGGPSPLVEVGRFFWSSPIVGFAGLVLLAWVGYILADYNPRSRNIRAKQKLLKDLKSNISKAQTAETNKKAEQQSAQAHFDQVKLKYDPLEKELNDAQRQDRKARAADEGAKDPLVKARAELTTNSNYQTEAATKIEELTKKLAEATTNPLKKQLKKQLKAAKSELAKLKSDGKKLKQDAKDAKVAYKASTEHLEMKAAAKRLKKAAKAADPVKEEYTEAQDDLKKANKVYAEVSGKLRKLKENKKQVQATITQIEADAAVNWRSHVWPALIIVIAALMLNTFSAWVWVS